jgi:hypothetical protein
MGVSIWSAFNILTVRRLERKYGKDLFSLLISKVRQDLASAK